jgi:hypothetical protein
MVSGAFLPLLKKAAAAKERALLINLSSTLGSIKVALACQNLTNKNIAYCLTKVRKIISNNADAKIEIVTSLGCIRPLFHNPRMESGLWGL